MFHVQLAPVGLLFNLAMRLILIFLGMLQLYITAGLQLKTARYFGNLLGSDGKLMTELSLTSFTVRILIIVTECLKCSSFSICIQTIIFLTFTYIIL